MSLDLLKQILPHKEPPSADESLAAKDKRFLWHPFTQMKDWQSEEIVIIRRGEGVYLEDVNGRWYLDGVSSLWCNVHGHAVTEIDEAVKAQLSQVAHSTFLGLSNVPAIQLAEKLIKIVPSGLSRVFYSDSGSEAVEIALKMAFQYWALKGRPEKSEFVKLSHAYHGDTLGSVSVGGIDLFHEIFGKLLFKTHQVPAPYVYRWRSGSGRRQVLEEALAQLDKTFSEHHSTIAAFVMEPLMQGAAGMIDQPEGYLSGVRELTKKYNILLICDEVATGFGRTGKMFACDHEKISPDIMTVAKGLTGGYLPLAATITSEEVYNAFLGEYAEFKSFFHGHTYTANPLACAAAVANLDLFESRQVIKGLDPKIRRLEKGLKKFYDIPIVGDIRHKGLMAGIELVKNRQTKTLFSADKKVGIRVIEKARQKGIILRPLGSVIVLMPPLAILEDELAKLLDVAYESIAEVADELKSDIQGINKNES